MNSKNQLSCILAVAFLAGFSTVNAADPVALDSPRAHGSIERLDPALDELLGSDAKLEILAENFEWSEGPVWVPDGEYLLFSDIPRNSIYKWKEGEELSVYLHPSGFSGENFTGSEPGSNGLILDHRGRLILCQHGDRRLVRQETNGKLTRLADNYGDKRLNSPNDVVMKRERPSRNAFYFTDPPYGLPKRMEDPERELPFCGVYRRATNGRVTLLTDEISRPNGIGFSPDEQKLYVACSDPEKAVWYEYPVKNDGKLGAGRIFFDATDKVGTDKGLPDGLAIDVHGNLWATGPGGVLIFNPEGKHLGTIRTGEATANCTFGNDGTVLYITADMFLCRIQTKTKGLYF